MVGHGGLPGVSEANFRGAGGAAKRQAGGAGAPACLVHASRVRVCVSEAALERQQRRFAQEEHEAGRGAFHVSTAGPTWPNSPDANSHTGPIRGTGGAAAELGIANELDAGALLWAGCSGSCFRAVPLPRPGRKKGPGADRATQPDGGRPLSMGRGGRVGRRVEAFEPAVGCCT